MSDKSREGPIRFDRVDNLCLLGDKKTTEKNVKLEQDREHFQCTPISTDCRWQGSCGIDPDV